MLRYDQRCGTEVKYGFIEENKNIFSIDVKFSFFNVSRSGYYSWLNREPGKRELANKELEQKITTIFEANKSRYGAPRIAKVLEAQGDTYSLNRIARRRPKMKLKAIAKNKFKVTQLILN